MNIYAQRLLNVARACRETPAPDKFDMGWERHSCGTPGCAFGNYACRTDLQSSFMPKTTSFGGKGLSIVDGGFVNWDHNEVREHFGITLREQRELFHWEGCGGATSHLQAAEYIEAFVARKWPAPAPPNWRAIAASPLIPEHVRSEEATS